MSTIYVDAGPIRRHIHELRDAGIFRPKLAELTGVSIGTLKAISAGGTLGVTKQNAEAILAIPAVIDEDSGQHLIDPTGTHRRLQGMVAAGRSYTLLAASMNMSGGSVPQLLRAKRVRAFTARRVRDHSNEVWHQPPPDATAGQKSAITAARRMAARYGWVPLEAWDPAVIDDPRAPIPAWTTTLTAAGVQDFGAEIRTCDIEGCNSRHAAKGYCASHYATWKRTGNPHGARAATVPTAELIRMRAIVGLPPTGATAEQTARWDREAGFVDQHDDGFADFDLTPQFEEAS